MFYRVSFPFLANLNNRAALLAPQSYVARETERETINERLCVDRYYNLGLQFRCAI